MSSLSRLLRGSGTFNTCTIRRFSSAASETTAAISPPKKSLSSIVNEERNPKRIVDKFKTACESERFRANIAVYDRTVRRLVAAKRLHFVEEILEEQKKYPEMSKEGFAARIISLYGKAGLVENARKVFDEMPERNCKRTAMSFNALLSAYGVSKRFDVVEQLFNDLPDKLSIEPDIVSYNTLIKALCEKGSLSEAVALLREIENEGLKPDIITFNTLLLSSYLKGEFEQGEEIWAEMREKDVARDIRSYNARLLGLANETKSEELVSLFEELKASGIKPDVYSFNAMIRGSINQGKMEEAKGWYKEIVKQGYRPDKATLALLLPALCKAEDFGCAIELCKETFSKRYLVGQTTLQQLVDELVKGGKRREAEEIVEIAKDNDFLKFKLELSSQLIS
ncbi:Pentatricopeptide repeat-containing protein [Raphanus sativus]|uniref:Pentatricopeptide repeat-containing protein At1g55890, mitochondrial n=1 Tax=Raphanus sativus TaxID=3726 RepID=A0A6J0JYI1_RAPSA|nr:pentatricopeptide repeat-containing protein At1g55890, mitochondrial [Raphanus sativus]KAJ4889772.1 Pentatricopeptide repeat-containing protein [Raphanus sativus]